MRAGLAMMAAGTLLIVIAVGIWSVMVAIALLGLWLVFWGMYLYDRCT